jgi:cytochrome bd-type quinol oxidase subunit 2
MLKMIKKMKNVILVIASVATIAVPALVPAVAFAATDQIGTGLDCGSQFNVNNIGGNTTSDCPIDATGTGDRLNHILTLVVNIFSLIVGIVAVIMIIVGGLRYITSGGESSNVSTAKNTIIYAIVGLVVVALAQFIVHFVLAKVSQS